MYDSIVLLRPYFFSIREVNNNNNVCLDIKLPISWNYENITINYKSLKTQLQDKNDRYNLLSLISTPTKEGYDTVLACAYEIIKVNKENEEKKRLFEMKVKELEMLFQKESLEKLKVINFIKTHEQQESTIGQDTTSIRMVEQGSGEGQDGDRDTQDEDD